MAGARDQAAAETVRRALATILVALAAVAWFANAASAHAFLVAVNPADGSILAQPPTSVTLRFNEAVTPGAVTLIDAQGRQRNDARVAATGDTIVMMVPSDLPQGSQIVSYRVISQDGHPVAGSMVFSVGSPSATLAPAPADPARDVLIWLTRIGLYVGLFAGVGGAFVLRWIAEVRAARAGVQSALGIGLVAAALSFGLLGLDLLGLPLRGLATFAPWTVALNTSPAASLAIAVVAIIVSLITVRLPMAGLARILAVLGLACVGLSLMVSGHAATASPRILAQAAIFIHGTAVAFWLGALGPLAILIGQSKAAALPAVNRFSRAAMPVVALLAITGLALATIELETPWALIGTNYGRLLLVKLALVGGLLALAAFNRYRLTPALGHDPAAPCRLQRTIICEGMIALTILAVVAGWRFAPPPRNLIPETPLAIHIHTDKAMFQVLVSPGRAGTNDFVLQLMAGDATLLQAKEAKLTLSLPSRGVEPLERSASLGPDKYWHVHGVALPLPGRWHVRIDALVSDFDEISLEDDIDVTQ